MKRFNIQRANSIDKALKEYEERLSDLTAFGLVDVSVKCGYNIILEAKSAPANDGYTPTEEPEKLVSEFLLQVELYLKDRIKKLEEELETL